ncbi:MAG TPA: glycoside hydrolase family 99-like domain-containing protein [Candidatus Babeliaceae bacterium]|nr:glycoside hydrolase family 99-like domain-containing protein [Candidatus Babeliaceae bacterium]
MQKIAKTTSKSIPLVSVVIPVYNTAKYLADCLDSVLAQTYSNIEIICIDDGSTDKSLAILKEYAAKHKEIKVFTQENKGVVVTRNIAVEKASGEYILPVDSDDKITRDCIEKLLRLFDETGCSIASPSVQFFGERKGKYFLPEPTARNMALQNCIVNCSMYKKHDWVDYGGYDESFVNGIEDYDFWWNFLQDGKTIARSRDVLFYYRIRSSDDLSRTQQTSHYHGALIQHMLQKYPLMAQLIQPSISQKLLRFGPRAMRYGLRITRHYMKAALRVNRIFKWRYYKNYVLNQQLEKQDFVPITTERFKGKPTKKLVAYYLPQYYQIPQNDEWFGRGFTEWSNTAKAVPQFIGHWQPHLPIDVGFYSLETTHPMHRQVELAKMYGIYGFCFYYYWFSGGSKIMEKPINNWLKDKNIDFPFMLFWANEDWTNTWGEQADIGTKNYSAKMKPSDVGKFVNDILPFFKDERYITVNGRPHLIIYQAKKDPYLPEFIKQIGKLTEKEGIKKPYISLVFPDENPDTFDPRDFGADAAVEFGVHMKARPDHTQQPLSNKDIVNPLAKIKMYDMQEFVDKKSYIFKSDYPVYKGAMTTYDNTARKIYTNAYLFSLNPSLYKKWLSELIKTSQTDTIFLAAWNEWAEGMHLEPDQRFGYAYLQATKDALEETK